MTGPAAPTFLSIVCPLCGGPTDSIWHRAWECTAPAAVKARNSVVSRRLVEEAEEAGCKNLLFSRAVVENPAVHAPLPLADGGVVLVVVEGFPDDVVLGGLALLTAHAIAPR